MPDTSIHRASALNAALGFLKPEDGKEGCFLRPPFNAISIGGESFNSDQGSRVMLVGPTEDIVALIAFLSHALQQTND